MADVPGRPDWGVLRGMMADLQKATRELPKLQQRMLSVTGTAWSPDGMIKAVVGPRGHLLELDIDPRVLRQPNSKALSASILRTVRAAVEEAGRQSSELLSATLPGDLRGLAANDMENFVGSHDADVRMRNEDGDE
ncbi:YbaB/EbfC family nucleoid-associated protein [Micromonospora sp. R77]|uniref:YbaB/EbfC family nucleoid-associated protein n=1 Tax=Micromonospora sp. R77 TaxID=2925836 RepID=UPI001F608A68|nr:YbaB/EbfC family nucleoid-associated protein [Micromonospora sp. R77]MCI4065033.1 YbaB/EbfC family nucleoid-associated protein [Micromonospora sp. R77]